MTPAERKAAERQRRAEKGLVRLEVWTLPECREDIRRYAEGATRWAKRLRKPPPE